MFVLHENSRPKKRPRDALGSLSGEFCKEPERGRKRNCITREDNRTGHWPPGFYDRLSKVHLTRGALREFERRTAQSKLLSPPIPNSCTITSSEPTNQQLKRFSRHGGPDLTHIRGVSTQIFMNLVSLYLVPLTALQFAVSHDRQGSMSQSNSSRKRSSATGLSGSGRSDSARKSKGSYDPNFAQNMIDRGIYPKGYVPYDRHSAAEPNNLDAITRALLVPRASLSPSRFPETAFREFERANDRAMNEARVMAEVFSIIEGKGRHKYYSDGPNHPFKHLDSLGEDLPTPTPDSYDGVVPTQIHRQVRKDLGKHIVPCNDTSRPAAPNFYVEGKSAEANPSKAKLQACHDGAVGARAMHSLQNYGVVEPKYDGNAYSQSASFHGGTGTLKLYTHHMTPPEAPGGRPEYHMTQLRSFSMTDNAERFREGATGYRNARDLAELQRNSFVEGANRVARHAPNLSTPPTATRSQESRSPTYREQADTSPDDVAAGEAVRKRHRHALTTTRPEDTGPTTAAPGRGSRHAIGSVENKTHSVASVPGIYSRHTMARDGNEAKRQVRPTQKVRDSGWDTARGRVGGRRSRHS